MIYMDILCNSSVVGDRCIRGRLEMTWRFVETAFCDTVTLTFGDGDVRLERRVNTNAGPLERPTPLGRAA